MLTELTLTFTVINMSYNLQALKREIKGRAVRRLRVANKVPAVLYGTGAVNQMLTVERNKLEAVYRDAGYSALVDLQIDDNAPLKVLIQDMQRDPVRDEPLHVDFFQVDMNKKITTEVALHFIGEAPAVKELSGTLNRTKSTVTIECLPADLIQKIEVDLSSLKTFNDVIHVADLIVGDQVKILDEAHEAVASVVEPRVLETVAVATVEGAEETKVGDKQAEGEEAKAGDAATK